MRIQRVVIPVFVLFVGTTWGCQQRQDGWVPVLEETSTTFLETEADRLLDDVRMARSHVATDPSRAEAALAEAESSLEHLTDYYLPLFQARERAYNAYRSLYLGDRTRLTQELDRIRGLLGEMAEMAQGGRLQEIQALGEALADARLAVQAGPEEGGPALERLARSLNLAALKGDLVLRR
jgi:hypothetical protein